MLLHTAIVVLLANCQRPLFRSRMTRRRQHAIDDKWHKRSRLTLAIFYGSLANYAHALDSPVLNGSVLEWDSMRLPSPPPLSPSLSYYSMFPGFCCPGRLVEGEGENHHSLRRPFSSADEASWCEQTRSGREMLQWPDPNEGRHALEVVLLVLDRERVSR